MQLCAQGLLLREHGFRSNEGVIYFAASRERSVREFARRPRRQKLIEAALRPFAPLL